MPLGGDQLVLAVVHHHQLRRRERFLADAEEGEQLYDEDDVDAGTDNDSTLAGNASGNGNGGEKDGSKQNFSDLIVLGLPFKLTEKELRYVSIRQIDSVNATRIEFREYFEQFGTVALAEIKRKDSGNSKGFGFVRMDSMEGQIRVLNKPVHTIGNRKCQVKVPLSKVFAVHMRRA